MKNPVLQLILETISGKETDKELTILANIILAEDIPRNMVNFFSAWDYWDRDGALKFSKEKEVQEYVSKMPKPKSPIAVYRGLKLNKDIPLENLKSTNVGHRFIYKDEVMSSWSHNKLIAKSFATDDVFHTGIVVKTIVDPNDIFWDLDKAPDDVKQELNIRREAEVILNPGSYSSEIVEKVKFLDT